MKVDFMHGLSSEVISEVLKSKLLDEIPVLVSFKIRLSINEPGKWVKGCYHIVLVTGFDNESLYFNETGRGVKDKLPINFAILQFSDDRDILIIEQKVERL